MPDVARRQLLLATLAATSAAALGGCDMRQALPPLDYTLLDGSPGHSAELRGKVVRVAFWATSCAVCVRDMPELVATHLRFQPRGLETLAVAMRHDAPARVADFAQSRRLPFGVVIDNMGALARAFGDVQATPTSFLLDRRGAIARQFTGTPDPTALHALVERLLAEGAPPANAGRA